MVVRTSETRAHLGTLYGQYCTDDTCWCQREPYLGVIGTKATLSSKERVSDEQLAGWIEEHSGWDFNRYVVSGTLRMGALESILRELQERRAVETCERLSSGDAIACISMALQNPADTQEWARLLSDCRYVIEKLEDELIAAKRSRNDEQRLRRAAEKANDEPPTCRICDRFTGHSSGLCDACRS